LFSEKDLLIALPPDDLVGRLGTQLSRKTWVFHAEESEAASAARAFLTKMMTAVRLDLEQEVCLCHLSADQGASVAGLVSTYKPRHILVFGVPAPALGLRINILPYQPVNFYDTDWIFADALPVLEHDKDLKGRLWTAMKQVFG
jgi:hypothetical protein